MSPQTPTSEVIERDEQLPFDDSSRYVAKEGRRQPVARDARDLDVVHRQHHAARAAALGERRAHVGELLHAVARAAELDRDGGGKQLRLPQRVERLMGKTRLGVDVGSVRDGDLLSDGTGQARDFISRRHGLTTLESALRRV